MKPYYLTTAIDYSNGDPHLGHALEKVGADAIARWHRLRGEPVRFLMGMDENAQKVIQAAEAAGRTPAEWLDAMSERFRTTWERLECTPDVWMRTTEPRHARGVIALIEAIRARNPNDLYQGEYQGLYCVGCEEYKSESQVVDGRCIEHPSRELVLTRERNTFFRLSRWRDAVLEAINTGKFRVEPAIRRNEVLRVLEAGLQDISISRSRAAWGIPFSGAPDETVYVWFDALINYLSATGYPDPEYQHLWPADLHVVGKGITRFHCIIWPAMLMAAEVELPKQVWAHGYVQWGGAKVSKSEGTSVSLDDAISHRGPDALRWFLLREVGFENDGDFSFERFDSRYDGDLANGLGNLASRVTAMLEKYRGGVVPTPPEALERDQIGNPLYGLNPAWKQIHSLFNQAMSDNALKDAASSISQYVTTANSYIVENAPWTLAKAGDDARLDTVLHALATCLFRLAVMTSPFMPAKAQALWTALGQPGSPETAWARAETPDIGGANVVKPDNLFPKPAA
ncbi:MAG: methionine--tRNA ligase [Gemmatimonadales bacterium]